MPQNFYKVIRKSYSDLLETEDDDILNVYVCSSYLNELEEAVSTNIKLVEEKSGYYYKAFINLLRCLIPFILCIGLIYVNPIAVKPSKTEISNLKDIFTALDSFTNKKLYDGGNSKKK